MTLDWRTWSWILCVWATLDSLLLGPSGRSCCTKNTEWCILVAWKLWWCPRTPCIGRGSIACILCSDMRPPVAFVACMMDTSWCQTRVSTLLGHIACAVFTSSNPLFSPSVVGFSWGFFGGNTAQDADCHASSGSPKRSCCHS